MAYTPTYVNNNSFLTPTLWNNTQDGIKNIKETTLETLEPTTNETWEAFLERVKTPLMSGYSFARVLRATVDGTSNIYFRCTRRLSSTCVWEGEAFNTSGGNITAIRKYYITVTTVSGSTCTMRRVTIDENGFTPTDISSSAATSLAIMGLNNNE